jgi:thioredoxin-like negative regulator of GroEL
MRATAYALALYALAAVAPNEVLAGGSSPIVLTDQNWDQELGSYEYVLVAFGASWCPYSRQLESTWNSAAVTYNGDTRIAFARIDCEENKSTCRNNNIMKYPTIKLYHNKQARPNEYRGSRTGVFLA